MAPSVDTLANSVANTVSNGLNAAASNGHALKNRVPSAAGSLLPTTETVQRDLVERILADSSAHDEIHLDGYTLSLGDIVGAARYGRTVKVADRPDIREKLDASVNFLRTQLENSVYGVTTGFGGSADTRTEDATALQKACVQLFSRLPFGARTTA